MQETNKQNGVESSLSRRSAQPSDIEFARKAHHVAYRDVVLRQFGKWDEEEQNKFFQDDWSGGTYEILLWDGVPCGDYSVEYLPDSIVVRDVLVTPEFQGKGIGTSLLKDVLERAKRENIPVKLGALKENRALNLYRRLGFKETGRNDTHTMLEFIPKNEDS